eukprot:3130939-Alexandrium_andersonii.AAC.1
MVRRAQTGGLCPPLGPPDAARRRGARCAQDSWLEEGVGALNALGGRGEAPPVSCSSWSAWPGAMGEPRPAPRA